MITSQSNPTVRLVKRLQGERRVRDRESAFVIEGTRWLAELVRLGRQAEEVLYTVEWSTKGSNADLLRTLGSPARLVSESLMMEMSAMEQAPGVLAIVRQETLLVPAQPTFLLVLDNVRVPGNLGAIARTAAAAGVSGMLLSPGCVDFYNPKVVHGAMGAHLRLPVRKAVWDEIGEMCAGLATWLAAGDATRVYTDVDWCTPSALVIGSEASGASGEASKIADGGVRIPMAAETESLNAAMAAGIILFEVVRQRGGL